jgi:guanylate kinase
MHKGSLFIISAPSGAGKTTLVRSLLTVLQNVEVSVSYTTRNKRAQEKEDTDYHFVTQNTFKEMLKKDAFLEHAQVFGNFYGTSRLWVEETRAQGIDVILEIDWQGARQVRTQFVEAQSIFILPPSREALSERLLKRHPNNDTLIAERMSDAKDEISRYNEYDYLVCNDRFEEALEDLKSIIRSHRLQWRRSQNQQKKLIEKLLS